MQKIIPNLWFNKNAEAAGEFYAAAFGHAAPGGASSIVEARYPESGLPDFQRDFAGLALTVDVRIGDTHLTLINSDGTYSPNPSISFMLNFDPMDDDGDVDRTRARLTGLWDTLSDGGMSLMPLAEYPFSTLFGWVQDKYGVSWQLILTNPEGEPRPFLLPALMFCGPAQNRASEMVDFYLELFRTGSRGQSGEALETEVGTRSYYPEPTGPATTESIQFSEFRVGDQWFVAMDSGVEQPFTFAPGVSLSVQCRDQVEIDHLWDALSTVPEAEQCGWLVDRAGVSWQIVPENMGELMQRPGAYERMLKMKKLVIADF